MINVNEAKDLVKQHEAANKAALEKEIADTLASFEEAIRWGASTGGSSVRIPGQIDKDAVRDEVTKVLTSEGFSVSHIRTTEFTMGSTIVSWSSLPVAVKEVEPEVKEDEQPSE